MREYIYIYIVVIQIIKCPYPTWVTFKALPRFKMKHPIQPQISRHVQNILWTNQEPHLKPPFPIYVSIYTPQQPHTWCTELHSLTSLPPTLSLFLTLFRLSTLDYSSLLISNHGRRSFITATHPPTPPLRLWFYGNLRLSCKSFVTIFGLWFKCFYGWYYSSFRVPETPWRWNQRFSLRLLYLFSICRLPVSNRIPKTFQIESSATPTQHLPSSATHFWHFVLVRFRREKALSGSAPPALGKIRGWDSRPESERI